MGRDKIIAGRSQGIAWLHAKCLVTKGLQTSAAPTGRTVCRHPACRELIGEGSLRMNYGFFKNVKLWQHLQCGLDGVGYLFSRHSLPALDTMSGVKGLSLAHRELLSIALSTAEKTHGRENWVGPIKANITECRKGHENDWMTID